MGFFSEIDGEIPKAFCKLPVEVGTILKTTLIGIIDLKIGMIIVLGYFKTIMKQIFNAGIVKLLFETPLSGSI